MVQMEEDKNVFRRWQGKWSNVSAFYSEHEPVILLLVTDLLFWLIYVIFHVPLIIILLYFLLSGIWPKPTSSPSELGRRSSLSSAWSMCEQG